jgi:hypothetical protein
MERNLCEKICSRLMCYSREEESRKKEERPCNDAAQAPVFGRPSA